MAQKHGVGSNQHRERLVYVDEDERRAALENAGHMVIPAAHPSAQAERTWSGTVAEAVANHRDATEAHLESALEAPPSMSDKELLARLDQSVKRVAAAEDDILSRQPNLYGYALISANNFLARAKQDPLLRQAIDNGDEDAHRVLNACERLLRDAEDMDLDVDGISQAISDLEGGGAWSAMEMEGSESLGLRESEDMSLSRRVAALSVASSRSSSPEERQALAREMDKNISLLRERRLRSLG